MAIVPSICFGQSVRFTNLVREKERKMAELEKCLGSTQGLKIAGLSTLGLTAVGVAGNIYEAQKINDYDTQTQKVEKKIESVQKDIDAKQECEKQPGKKYIKNECVDDRTLQSPAQTSNGSQGLSHSNDILDNPTKHFDETVQKLTEETSTKDREMTELKLTIPNISDNALNPKGADLSKKSGFSSLTGNTNKK